MYKFINRFAIIGLFLVVSIISCENTGELDLGEMNQPRFSYEIYDESNATIKTVTHERIGDIEIETSLGLFGDQFFPPWIVENSGINPDLLKRHEIWLHAEKSINEDVQFVTLRFGFSNMKQWEKKTFQIPEKTKDAWLDRLRSIWEILQNHLYAKNKVDFKTAGLKTAEQFASMDYFDSAFATEHSYGLKIDSTNYISQSMGGYVELESVSNDRVKGNFKVDVASLPMKSVFFVDEFPEDPEIQMFRISGNFITEPGDYYDLVERTRAKILGELMNVDKGYVIE